jgi:hypothetical protein
VSLQQRPRRQIYCGLDRASAKSASNAGSIRPADCRWKQQSASFDPLLISNFANVFTLSVSAQLANIFASAVETADVAEMSGVALALSQLSPSLLLPDLIRFVSLCGSAVSLYSTSSLMDTQACKGLHATALLMHGVIIEDETSLASCREKLSDLLQALQSPVEGSHGIFTAALELTGSDCACHKTSDGAFCSHRMRAVELLQRTTKILVQQTMTSGLQLVEESNGNASEVLAALNFAIFGNAISANKTQDFSKHDSEFGIPIAALVAYPLKILQSHYSPECSSHQCLQATACRELFHTIAKAYTEKCLLTPLREEYSNVACSSELCLIDSFMEEFLELAKAGCDDACGVVADLYRIRSCAVNMTSASSCALPRQLDDALFSLTFCPSQEQRGAGWLDCVGAVLLLGGKSFASGGRYLVEKLVQSVVSSIASVISGGAVMRVGDRVAEKVECVISSVMSVTAPHLREALVAKSLFRAALTQSVGSDPSFSLIFAVVSALLRSSRCEWRDGTPTVRRGFRKTVLQQFCLAMEQIAISSAPGGLDNCTTATYCSQLSQAAKMLNEELRHCVSAGNPSRKSGERGPRRIPNKAEDTANRQSHSALLGDAFEAAVLFLSVSITFVTAVCPQANVSRQTFHESSGDVNKTCQLCRLTHALVKLLSDVVSCPPIAIVNSNIGSIVLMLRHLTVAAITLASSDVHSAVSGAGQVTGVDVLRVTGRALMACASSKHLHRHAYLMVVSVIDALTGFTKKSGLERIIDSSVESSSKPRPVVVSSTKAIGAGSISRSIAISSSDETLRENLLPGLFALLDRYNHLFIYLFILTSITLNKY